MDAKDHAILFLNWQRHHGHPLKDGLCLTKMILAVQQEAIKACAQHLIDEEMDHAEVYAAAIRTLLSDIGKEDHING